MMTPAARRRNTWESREGTPAPADGPEASEGAPDNAPDETAAPTRVELPWPAKALHPNARGHWSKRASAAKKAREAAGWAAIGAGLNEIDGAEAINATLTFHAPDNRRRDLDGMLSSAKSLLDGLADVIGVDDSRWSLSIRKAEPRPPHGAVIVEISVAS